MNIFFESESKTYFPVWKVTLKPGENKVADKIGKAMLAAHKLDCEQGKANKDKPRFWEVEPKVQAVKAQPVKPSAVVTSAKDKKGVK